MPVKLALFASGNGTNAAAIIDYFASDKSIEVSLIVSSKPDAGVLNVADRAGVESVVISKAELADEELVLGILEGFEVDYIILAGWLLLIPSYLVQAFKNRMLNIHPALLPKYGGKGMWGHHVHEAVKQAGESETGITIHQVNEAYDEGAIVAQFKVALSPADSAASIESKVRELELKHYAPTIKKIVQSSEK